MPTINASVLSDVRTGFSSAFQGGLGMAPPDYLRVTTVVTASTKEQTYGWLGKIPRVREWIGPRAVQNMMVHGYTITEKPWEDTVSVDRDDIETDNLGVYTPMFTEMGRNAAAFWNHLTFDLLKAGFDTTCYDGQYFFDTDHPVLDANGVVTSVSNDGGGSGTPWFLIDANSSLKPIILQRRKDFEFVAKDRATDDNVFWQKEFVYGIDARANVGYGLWQTAYGSKDTLNATTYATARAAISGMKGDYGTPLGLMPNLLVVPPSLESAARKLLMSEYATGGETNEWKGSAELLVARWLA